MANYYIDSAAATSSNTIWYRWTGTSCSTATTASTAVWIEWNQIASTTTIHDVELTPTAEQLAEERRRQQELQARLKAAAAEKEAAEQKAAKLLAELLSPDQRKEYSAERAFRVVGGDGVQYRIKEGWAGNVEELDTEGVPVARYCLHPREPVPVADNLVAQKLMLETDPASFRRIANRTELLRRREPVAVS